jgi:SAM-dependent methyltransferase
MCAVPRSDVWASATAYEPFVGRWSRPVAREFLGWLGVPAGRRWLDVGCGTGALTGTILATSEPAGVVGIDPSEGFVTYARETIFDQRARFEVGDARALPFEAASFDTVVSGLVLNFVPAPEVAVGEMARVARPGGMVAAYVWDYADNMQLIRLFWDAAITCFPSARELDEGRRFPLCQPEPLANLFRSAGLRDVAVRAIDVPTTFRDFDDYWRPFLGGQAPAPGYVVSLAEDQRMKLRETLRGVLPHSADGSIALTARAWAVKGTRRE